MMRRHAIRRALVAALALFAIGAPAAVARPGGPASAAAAKAREAQSQVYWSYDYEAPKPAPAPSTPQAQPPVAPDDGTPWTAIVIGLAGASVLAGGLVAATRMPAREAR